MNLSNLPEIRGNIIGAILQHDQFVRWATFSLKRDDAW